MWDDVLLYQASCSKMKIERLKIANSDLAHSDWSGSVAQTLEFNDSRLAGVNFSGLYAGRLVADKCGAYGINFYKADIKEVALVGTGADKSHWRHAKIGSTSAGSFITKSDFRKADFEHAQLTNLRLRSATFPGAIFRDAELRVVDAANEPSEPRNDFVGADFLGAKLQDVVVDVDAPMSEIAIPKALRRKLARNTNTLTTYKITPVGLASPQDLGRVKF